ncbi:MAG: 50S ribosomal protein L17 [Bacillota bacterium]|nr:50S ribosomal protein L17 [Candidatus Fermentithermobacillaceae bacterium]
MGYSRFDRPTAQRKALLRGLVTSLFQHERVVTTRAKAKAAQPIAEKMITIAKKDTLAARRQAFAYINDEDTVRKLFETLGPRYAHRQGGYTRIIQIGQRKGDAAPMVILELVEPGK